MAGAQEELASKRGALGQKEKELRSVKEEVQER